MPTIMVKDTSKVGAIRFNKNTIPVYGNLDEPLFLESDVKEFIGDDYILEHDEYIDISDQRYITELGLYDILSQASNDRSARLWRRIIHEQLIMSRQMHGMDISEQFDEWDHMIDDYYFDEETGKLMQSVTVAGGDVEQVEVI